MSYRHGRMYVTESYINAKNLSFLYRLRRWENNAFCIVLILFQHVAVHPSTYICNTSFNWRWNIIWFSDDCNVMYTCLALAQLWYLILACTQSFFGPKTDPSGIPKRRPTSDGVACITETHRVMSVRYDLI